MRPNLPALAVLCAASAAMPALAQSTCNARSASTAPTVVELYTSEGCSSCPPADAWLSTLKPRADLIAIAFHVDYWDRLGWKDRFASPVHTERQQRVQRPSGARFVYTPQVIVNGRDWRGWPGAALPAPAASAAEVELTRGAGARVDALVTPRGGAPARLAAYWVALEDGHVSAVRAGENTGATLHHDAVVRSYLELPAWSGREPRRLQFDAPPAEADRAAAVALVVVDAETRVPVAAAKLAGC